MRLKSPESRGFHGIIETAPESACNTRRGLTRSSGISREGLPDMVPKTCSFDGCEKLHLAKGLCRGHYSQRRRGAALSAIDTAPKTLAQILLARTLKTNGCWVWTGGKNLEGYGQLRSGQISLAAHRVAYELAHGEILPGYVVDHMCHNPACVRPDHLRQVTRKQNNENRLPRTSSFSGVRGVTWRKDVGKWQARVTHDRQVVSVGFFESLDDARLAVVAMRNKLHTHNDLDRTGEL